MALLRLAALVALLFSIRCAVSDDTVYVDGAIENTWQDWSWSSTINYAATDVAQGSSSISVTSDAWSALSLFDTTGFTSAAGLTFDFVGDPTQVQVYLTETSSNTNSPTISLSSFTATAASNGFSTYLMNFNSLPPSGQVAGSLNWDRVTWQALGNGATYHIDNIIVLDEIVITPEFLSAEPLGSNVIAMTSKGDVDFSTVKVTIGGRNVAVSARATVTPAETPTKTITYLTLASAFSPAKLVVTAGNATFQATLPSTKTGTIDPKTTRPISSLIYGINFPPDANTIKELGITLSRWGGNAATAYNPFGDFTNAGADWFFENRANDGGNADNWISWVSGAGSSTTMLIPSLDWVAKDNSSYSYSKTLYPNQKAFDPFNADAGDGQNLDGTVLTPAPDPNTAYVPWNMTAAKTWLSGLKNKPTFVTVDNEIEIASSTHSDMHPVPLNYDEELARVLNVSTMAKATLPNSKILAPSTCSWWFYWTSAVGRTDAVAHNNTDFIPWFLQQMNTQSKKTGQRLLDYLDLHYYFQADTSAGDAAAEALRLRMTRSWWDPTYVDESWVGTSQPQNNQPNATIVQFIPRIQALISQYYPGTKLSVSEWSAQGDNDVVGGLVVTDSLGILGRYGVDAATYWGTATSTNAVGLAFWLFNGNGRHFGSSTAKVSIPSLNPDTLGVYASTNAGKNTSLVIVNKDPANVVSLSLSGIPKGNYFLRHFGGQAGLAKFQTTVSLGSASYIAVPPYTAVFLQQA